MFRSMKKPSNKAVQKFKIMKSEQEWKSLLTKQEYYILRLQGTQNSVGGEYDKVFPKTGYFGCRGCGTPLYSTSSKVDLCGWVSFDKCLGSKKNGSHVAAEAGSPRVKRTFCRMCGGHQGHVFYGERQTKTNERH